MEYSGTAWFDACLALAVNQSYYLFQVPSYSLPTPVSEVKPCTARQQSWSDAYAMFSTLADYSRICRLLYIEEEPSILTALRH